MAAKQKPCTIGPKHKWDWIKDTTVRNVSLGGLGGSMSISRKGIYTCACGQRKYGAARSGL